MNRKITPVVGQIENLRFKYIQKIPLLPKDCLRQYFQVTLFASHKTSIWYFSWMSEAATEGVL